MKKIYMILAAVFALLSLSLNAQTTYYQKVTSQTDLTNGEYLIVNEANSKAFDGSTTSLNSTGNAITVTISDSKIASSTAVDAATFTIDFAAGTIKSASGYYIGQTSNANGMVFSQTVVYTNSITLNTTSTNVDIVGTGGAYLRYNSSSTLFRYYKSSTYEDQKPVRLFKKITESAEPGLTAPVNGSTVNVGTNTGSGVSTTVNIKGSNLTQDLTVSVSGTGFSINRDVTVTAAEANAGKDVTVTYNGTDASATGTLSITSSEVNTTVNLTASYNAGGQTPEIGTLNVFVDTATYVAEVLPVYGYNHDCTQHNQMIYPASLLTDMAGTKIKSMTFYPASYSSGYNSYSGINFYNGSVSFKLTEVNSSTGFDGDNPSFITGTMTAVKTVNMPTSANTSATTWLIEFDQEYEYNGGDLVIDVTTTTGGYGHTYFYIGLTSSLGVENPGFVNYSGDYSGSSAIGFVPAVTFTYELDDTPVLTAPENGTTVNVGTLEEGGETSVSVTIPVTGRNLTEDLTVSVSGTGFTVTPATLSATAVNNGTATVTVTYTGTDNGTGTLTIGSEEASTTVNLTATYIAHDPVLTAPVDGTTVDVGTNNGMGVSKTIAVSGTYLTEDLTVSVSGAGFSVSPTTISAADANAGTATVTVTYNGTTDATGTLTISSGEVSTTVNLTGTYSTGIAPTAHGMVRMGTLRIVDQFAEKIPATNDHPYRYTYFLKLATRDTTSSPARVPAQHTGAEMKGYYTHAEMKGDTDPANFLTEDVLSAEVDMNLSPSSAPYFYTINSVKNGVPASVTSDEHYNSYISVMQRREAGDYQEMQYGSPYLNDIEPAGEFDFFDFRKEVANQKDDSLSYVPIVWTKGIDRHYYVDDSLHNSYGAPIWEVRTGDVMIDQSGTVCQRQVAANGGWNSTVNYTVDGTDYSLYLVSVNAQGILPISNIEYEPYMFRLWLYDDNASLRNYTWMENNNWTKIEDAGAYTDNGGKWKLLDTYMCENWGGENGDQYDPDLNYVVNINQGTSANPQSWQNNIGFVAPINGFTPKLYVRFYYKIKGSVDPNTSGMRGAGDEDNVGYVVLRGVNPDPGTGVHEIVVNGEVESQTFYNVQGMQSDKPFEGINIVVTRYSNGATTTTKVRY